MTLTKKCNMCKGKVPLSGKNWIKAVLVIRSKFMCTECSINCFKRAMFVNLGNSGYYNTKR